jgi:hypothetical protein
MHSRTRRWIKRTCKDLGVADYEIKDSGCKHLKLVIRHSNKQALCVLPRTPSCPRSQANQRAQIKRILRGLKNGQG